MADNVTFQKTELATPASGTKVSTDEAASGHLQRVKLAYSADGVDTHVQADGSGLLVNLGAHEDAVGTAMATSDIGIATKSAIFGYTTSGGGAFEPVKVTPSGALTVEVSDGGGSITVDGTVAATQSGTWNVGITGNVALPAGAATEYSLALAGSNLAAVTTGSNLRVLGLVDSRQSGPWSTTIAGTVPVTDNGGSLTVDGTVAATQSGTWNVGITGGVSLPTGAATEYSLALAGSNLAAVTTGSNLRVLGLVDARQSGAWTTAVSGTVPVTDNGGSLTVDGTVGISGSVAVTGTFYQATQPVSGTVTANAGTGPFPVSDNAGSLTVDAPVGTPVFVRLSDGAAAITTLPVSLATAPSTPVTNTGTFAVQAAQSGTWNINNVAGTITLPTGAATETSVAAVAATASGSNLRVTVTNPTPVISSGAAVSTVASSASSVTLLAANVNRKGWAFYNDSTQFAYVKFGATASTTSFTVRVDPAGYYESGPTIYGGVIDCIWAAANGSARLTEW